MRDLPDPTAPADAEWVPYGQHPDDTPDWLCPIACRNLWIKILADFWDASFNPKGFRVSQGQHVEREAVLRWFGTDDFGEVCMLAGFDPVAILQSWRRHQKVYEQTGVRPAFASSHRKRAYG
ncbi:hypothetical protein [Palleronia caenipelagi]|uniref:Uncharacterized protein n=1 Tax=Palleronia caenipelagi TaxID=2489174 RepID=A0A547PSC1_9RHOB|nr:hypothetical protein [Palleronia caenipelagi]TRD16944.1 hypothetical protein FEV53_13475 [Palleronia caenipelagi]